MVSSLQNGEEWRNHLCGLYSTVPSSHKFEKLYLPQVELQSRTTIVSTTSRTSLTQTFVNPSETKGIKRVTYAFPLYDGVNVVGFTCRVGERTIVGEVKEKEKAKAVFQGAVNKRETARLFEQLPDASDVFTTTIGNVPPGATVVINITYLGELKHDLEVNGIRFTIPNIIYPRYGDYPMGLVGNLATSAQGKGISITVDAEMPDGSFIQQIRSPSHPISISIGTTSLAPTAEPTMSRASATLSLGTTQLDTDFVLQVIAKDSDIPKAILETHPTMLNHRALMATLVPKFSLPSERPEVVFVCDRSGRMSGSRIRLVIQALKIFLKSLPVGVKFNICYFGSSHSFLWPRSVTYNQQNLDLAIKHAETFEGNYGATEMLEPLKATIEQRYKDIPLEVILLTDGNIQDAEMLFSYLKQEVSDTKSPIRVFTLGIGNVVSHSLIEGVAKAGNGFSQTVGEGEKMDTKVVRMLKGALSPHINDYTLEVQYSDDYGIIEKNADSLTVKLIIDEEKKEAPKQTISLFNKSVDLDKLKEEPPIHDQTGESRYSHIPKLTVPRTIQAPQIIPSLFAFNRTTVYLLLGPEAPEQTPRSVVLRGTSVHGPLKLKIPIQILDTPGETIHRLAAKRAVSELEEGRGWLPAAKFESGKSVKETYEGRFQDMVEREAVRLGVQFQVGGKWCSFVAIEKTKAVSKSNDYDACLDVVDSSPNAIASNTTVRYESVVPSNPVVPSVPQQQEMQQHQHAQLHSQPQLRQEPLLLPVPGNARAMQQLQSSLNGNHQPLSYEMMLLQLAKQQNEKRLQMQLLEQQDKKRLLMERKKQGGIESSLFLVGAPVEQMQPIQSSPDGNDQFQRHNMQTQEMHGQFLKQQNKNRLLMARQEQDGIEPSPFSVSTPVKQMQPSQSSLQNNEMQMDLLEPRNKKRRLMAKQK
ncbi:hypothetical protein K504DRAFT_435978 [Pleomassaria siparia CBS 279.74]|uniref:VIT-domain-containing protein n=1 Tax=Pleomassaria siparia CBS 279.74 TaxID=1314801 RepID=A0A6G1K4T4_9PLEO|nr:hypothetical protein K504DRAFT_435978 [Pleomassaria siparia CBS 279.74]